MPITALQELSKVS